MPEIVLQPLPPEEAIAYFRAKGFRPTWRWAEMWHEDHAKAVTVAKAMRLDILQDIRGELDRAIAEGTTHQDFQKRLTPILQSKGWWGKQRVVGPAGPETVQLGSPHRLRTIFHANIQTAYQVGHYRQMTDPAVLKARPYWRYSAVLDSRTRPMHRAWHGTILPADDPWWSTHYPPNGFRCFPEGTPVLTPSGWRPIETIRLHDRVIGGSGQPQLVTATHRNDFNGHILRLGAKGLTMTVTPNHRILTLRGWVRADGLHAGDILVQTVKTPGIEARVGDVDDAHAKRADGGMSLPTERETAVALAFDRQVYGGHKQIEPPGADSGMDDMVMDHAQPMGGQMIERDPFRTGWGGRAGRVESDVAADDTPTSHSHLCPDVGASGACRDAQPGGDTTHTLIGLRGLPEAGVTAFPRLAERHLPHRVRGAQSSLVGADPLRLDGVAPLARRDLIIPHQPHQGAHIDMPPSADLPVGSLLLEVETAEDFAGGAPFDRFDTLEDFTAWAWSHAHLHVIESITTIPYSGIVCNLTVEHDRSYVIPGATVHNCRCTVVTVSTDELDRGVLISPDRGITHTVTPRPNDGTYEWANPHTGEVLTIPRGIDPGWAYNPGAAPVLWDTMPVGSKVRPNQPTWRDLGRPDLRRIPDTARHEAPGLLPAGRTLDQAVEIVAHAVGLREGQAFVTVTTKDGDLAVIHRDRLSHLVQKRDDARERYARYILPTIQDPYEIWLTDYDDGLRKQYVGLYRGSRDLLAVVRLRRDGSILWNIMQARDKDMNIHRVGTLLYGK